MHSSQDVCIDCERQLLEFQTRATPIFKQWLRDLGCATSIKEERFKIIFRATSVRQSSFSEWQISPARRDDKHAFSRIYMDETPRNIKTSSNAVILHSDKNLREKLEASYDPSTYSTSFFTVPRYTVFRNRTGPFNPTLPSHIPTTADIHSALQEVIPGECDLYLISEMPGEKDLKEKYKNTYLFIKTKPMSLFYISNKGKHSSLIIDHQKFNQIKIADIKESVPLKDQVPKQNLDKFWNIITLNEGHAMLEKTLKKENVKDNPQEEVIGHILSYLGR